MQSVILKVSINPDNFPFIWDRINDIVQLLDEMYVHQDLDRFTYINVLEKLYSIKDYLQFIEALCKKKEKFKCPSVNEFPEEEFLEISKKFFL